MSDVNVTYDKSKKEVVVHIPCSEQDVEKAERTPTSKKRMVAMTGGFVFVQGAPGKTKISVNLITD